MQISNNFSRAHFVVPSSGFCVATYYSTTARFQEVLCRVFDMTVISQRIVHVCLVGEDLRKGESEPNRVDCVWIGITIPITQ